MYLVNFSGVRHAAGRVKIELAADQTLAKCRLSQMDARKKDVLKSSE